jgi:hypothetical protein
MDTLLVNVNVNGYESNYTIDRILQTGFITQQVIIEDKSKAKVIKALVEGGEIAIDIFFFNTSADKNNIYSEFNTQPEIKELKQFLFPYLDKSNVKNAKLPRKLDNIGIAIFPMYVWMQSDILKPYGGQASLFDPSKTDEIHQELSHIQVLSMVSTSSKSRSRSRSRSRSKSRSKSRSRSTQSPTQDHVQEKPQKTNTRKKRK